MQHNHKIHPVPELGPNRTILMEGGAPALVGAIPRPSTTAPGRIKVVLATPVGEDDMAVLVEFRLEMN